MSEQVVIKDKGSDRTRDEKISERYKDCRDNLIAAFPQKAEKCLRLVRGYKNRPGDKKGRGAVDKQKIHYPPCMYPKCDEEGNLIRVEKDHNGDKVIKDVGFDEWQKWQRCNYTPSAEKSQAEQQIDMMIHCERHAKWFMEHFSSFIEVDGKTYKRPPKHIPEPWQTPGFPPKWGQKGDELIEGEGIYARLQKEKINRNRVETVDDSSKPSKLKAVDKREKK